MCIRDSIKELLTPKSEEVVELSTEETPADDTLVKLCAEVETLKKVIEGLTKVMEVELHEDPVKPGRNPQQDVVQPIAEEEPEKDEEAKAAVVEEAPIEEEVVEEKIEMVAHTDADQEVKLSVQKQKFDPRMTVQERIANALKE